MATTKIDIKKAINPTWLIQNKCVLILPKCPVHKVRLSAILWGNIPKAKVSEQVRMFLECTEGIAERHLYRYYKHNFAFNDTTIGVRLMKKEDEVEKLKEQSFLVEVRELVSGLTRYHFKVSPNKVEELEQVNEPKLDMLEINELRNQELSKPALPEKRTPQEIDDLGMKISKLVATGIYSVYDACNQCGVKWVEFMGWYTENPYIYELYNQAIRIARFFKNSSYETIADKMLFELLQSGKMMDVSVDYDMIYPPFKPEGYFVASKKKVQEKSLTLRDILDLKRAVQGMGDPIPQADTFETMNQEELAEKIQEMTKQVNKAKKEREKELKKKK